MSKLRKKKRYEAVHQLACKNLQLTQADLAVHAANNPVTPVIPELIAMLDSVLSLVKADEPFDAEAIFRGAIQAMDVVEAKRFVLDNLLEGLKRGETPGALVKRFTALGLFESHANATTPSPNSDADLMGEVTEGRGLLKQTALAIAQMAVNAMRAIPKFVEIEPSIHLVGPLPVLSFALKGKGMSLQELFEALRAPGRFFGKPAPAVKKG